MEPTVESKEWHEALDYLRGDYDKAAIRTIVECRTRCGFRIDIIKTATFSRLTRALGGTVSPLSLQLHHWCDCFREDHDAAFILAGVREGFDWEKVAPTSEHDTPNCVPAELEDRVNDRVETMLASGEIIAVERHDVHTISPLMVVDKDHSNFEKFRLVHNLSAPKGDRPTRAFKLDVAETYRLGTEHPH